MKNLVTRLSISAFILFSGVMMSPASINAADPPAVDLSALNADTGFFDVREHLQTDGGNEANMTLNATDDPNNLLYKIIKLMITVMGTLAVLFYIIAAYFMMTSQGDENQIQKGKTIFLYTTLGVVLAFLSYILVQFGLNIIFQTA